MEVGRKRRNGSLVSLTSSITSSVLNTMSKVTGKKTVKITEDMIRRTEVVLPPLAPDSLDGIGKRDISTYATTWNMDNRDLPSRDAIKFWLPKGYDVYVLCLQKCTDFMRVGDVCADFLSDDQDEYLEQTHFAELTYKKKSMGNNLVIVLLIHRSLVDESVFKTSKILQKSQISKRRSNVYNKTFDSELGVFKLAQKHRNHSGAIALQFEVFDTKIIVVNVQLATGNGNTKRRLRDMGDILRAVNSMDADHVLLMGFMGSTFFGDGGTRLTDFVPTSYRNDSGWGTRFMGLTQYDEVQEQLQPNVPGFSRFEELPIHFPPTSQRKIRSTPVTADTLALMFHTKFNLESLYQYSQKKQPMPAHTDRIFWMSFDSGLSPCIAASVTGSCEGITNSSHVPVFTSFRMGNKSFGVSSKGPVPNIIPVSTDSKMYLNGLSPVNKQVKKKKGLEKTPFSASTPFMDVSAALREMEAQKHASIRQELEQSPEEQKIANEKRLTLVQNLIKNQVSDDDEEAYFSDDAANEETQANRVKVDEEISPNSCQKCKLHIFPGTSYYEASGRMYHKPCFTCEHCLRTVTSKYYLVNGLLYCERDYKTQFETSCVICEDKIEGLAVKTSAGAYHERCFRCADCNTELTERVDGMVTTAPFEYKEDRLLCVEHAKEKLEKTCFVCSDTIGGARRYETLDPKTMQTLDAHASCFSCKVCKERIMPDAPHKVIGNMIFCKKHGDLTCDQCHNSINPTEDYLDIHENKYHRRCQPKCTTCDKALESDLNVVKTGNSFMCNTCYMKNMRSRTSVFETGHVYETDRDDGLQSERNRTRRGSYVSVFTDISRLPPPPPPSGAGSTVTRVPPGRALTRGTTDTSALDQANSVFSAGSVESDDEFEYIGIEDAFTPSYATGQLNALLNKLRETKEMPKAVKKKTGSTFSSLGPPPPPPPMLPPR